MCTSKDFAGFRSIHNISSVGESVPSKPVTKCSPPCIVAPDAIPLTGDAPATPSSVLPE